MTNRVNQTTDLNDIYPDITGQLCNKHIKRLSQLKNTFEQIYDQMQPEQYIIINGIAKIIDLGPDLQLNFALQNGVAILLHKTYKNQDLYINGNHIDEELIFNNKGKHIEGIHECVDEITAMIKKIRTQSNGHEFYGGIIYVHSNIAQNLFAQREAFMLGILLALLKIHEELDNYTKQDIVRLLGDIDQRLSCGIISNILNQYEKGKCLIEMGVKLTSEVEEDVELDLTLNDPNSDKSIGTHDSNQSLNSLKKVQHKTSNSTNSNSVSSLQEHTQIKSGDISGLVKFVVPQNSKLILCKLDLAKDQQLHYAHKMERVKVILELMQQQKMTKFDIFGQNEDILKTSPFKDIVSHDQIQLFRYCQEIKQLLHKLTNNQLTFESFIKSKHLLDIKYSIFDEQVCIMLKQLQKQAKFLQNFCIIQGTILLICLDKQHYAEIVSYLRKLLNQYKFSTHRFLTTSHRVNCDIGVQIGQIMFTSMPSLGCAIYNPTEDVWI